MNLHYLQRELDTIVNRQKILTVERDRLAEQRAKLLDDTTDATARGDKEDPKMDRELEHLNTRLEVLEATLAKMPAQIEAKKAEYNEAKFQDDKQKLLGLERAIEASMADLIQDFYVLDAKREYLQEIGKNALDIKRKYSNVDDTELAKAASRAGLALSVIGGAEWEGIARNFERVYPELVRRAKN